MESMDKLSNFLRSMEDSLLASSSKTDSGSSLYEIYAGKILRPLFLRAKEIGKSIGKKRIDTLCLLMSVVESHPGDIFSKRNITAELLKSSEQPGFVESPHIIIGVTEAAAKLGVITKSANSIDDISTLDLNHIVWAIINREDCYAYAVLNKIKADINGLKEDIAQPGKMAHGRQAGSSKTQSTSFDILKEPKEAGKEASSVLENFGRDLTALAREGKIDPVIGREKEVSRTITILSKRKKNNALFVGEAGVGKTAMAEAIALKIASGDVPENLKNKRIIALDMTALNAGTAQRGSLEERLKKIIDEVQDSDIILFIDELHTIMGSGTSDTANMLKPALAREGFQCIGSTTDDEYRRFIEKDAALERRFGKIRIEEPSTEATVQILKGISAKYAKFHNCKYPDAVLEEAVTLADKFITYRNQPDKSIDLIDEAGVLGKNREVTRNDLIQVIEDWTGVKIVEEEEDAALRIKERIIGQDEIVDAVLGRIFGLQDFRKPKGVFLSIGPSGTGKTFLPKVVANVLRYKLVVVSMNNFKESFQASTLFGAPPGYVGYDDGSSFIESIKNYPQSVVLFDEIEKAHPDIFHQLLGILDNGVVTDSKGREINFKNAVVFMTANIKLPPDGTPVIDADSKKGETYSTRNLLESYFPPEFINRIDDIFTFKALEKGDISKIVRLELAELETRLRPRLDLEVSEEAINYLTEKCFHPESGAREVIRKISTEVTNPLSDFAKDNLSDGDVVKITLIDNKIIFSKEGGSK